MGVGLLRRIALRAVEGGVMKLKWDEKKKRWVGRATSLTTAELAKIAEAGQVRLDHQTAVIGPR